MKSFRRERAAERIRQTLTEMFEMELGEEELPPFFIHQVELSRDYGYARILLSPAVAGDTLDEPDLIRALKRLTPRLRAALTQRIQFRRTPELDFQVDRGKLNELRVETLLARIKKRAKSGGAAVILLGLLVGWGALRAESTASERFEAEARVMGTTFRVAAYGPDRRELATVVYSALDEARRLDAMLSNYREDSELSKINRRAAEGPVEVSGEMASLLAKCLEYSRRSEGAFDITVGRLMEVWGFFKGSGELPSNRAVRRALEQVGYGSVELAGGRVRFRSPGLQLDAGGVGKGYAVERIAAWLKRYGVESAMVSAGSSTLYAIGAPPGEPRGWKVDVRAAGDEPRTAETIYLRDESLSTSGSYEKFFTAGGVRYSHIMDPRTGRPAQGTAAVSVRSRSALDSEVWTTALFVLGLEWAREKAPPGLKVFFCVESGDCRWL